MQNFMAKLFLEYLQTKFFIKNISHIFLQKKSLTILNSKTFYHNIDLTQPFSFFSIKLII